MNFNLFKNSKRGGTFTCDICSCDHYITPKAIVNMEAPTCKECIKKKSKIIKKRPLKIRSKKIITRFIDKKFKITQEKQRRVKISPTKYTRLWMELSDLEKERAINLKNSGLPNRHVAQILKMDILSLYNAIYKKKYKSKKGKAYMLVYSRISSFTKGYSRFSVDDLLAKIGLNPKCYITGQSIDLTNGESYQLDHIIPKSKDGSSTIDNCGLCLKQVNQMKLDMSLEELKKYCKLILNIND